MRRAKEFRESLQSSGVLTCKFKHCRNVYENGLRLEARLERGTLPWKQAQARHYRVPLLSRTRLQNISPPLWSYACCHCRSENGTANRNNRRSGTPSGRCLPRATTLTRAGFEADAPSGQIVDPCKRRQMLIADDGCWLLGAGLLSEGLTLTWDSSPALELMRRLLTAADLKYLSPWRTMF
jgi:hypothetical protein